MIKNDILTDALVYFKGNYPQALGFTPINKVLAAYLRINHSMNQDTTTSATLIHC